MQATTGEENHGGLVALGLLSLIVGAVSGLVGVLFRRSLEHADSFRTWRSRSHSPWAATLRALPAHRRCCVARRSLASSKDGALAQIEQLLGRRSRKEMHGARDNRGPAGLVARTETCSVIAVEVLVEENMVAP